jgi:hypothetical protein
MAARSIDRLPNDRYDRSVPRVAKGIESDPDQPRQRLIGQQIDRFWAEKNKR